MPTTPETSLWIRRMIALALRLLFVVRLECDQEAAGVERLIGAVNADERGQALDVRILQDLPRQLALQFRHRLIGDALRRLRNGLDHPGVLYREEALRDKQIENNSERQRQHCDQ